MNLNSCGCWLDGDNASITTAILADIRYTSYYEKQCNTMYVIWFYFNYKITEAIFTNK